MRPAAARAPIADPNRGLLGPRPRLRASSPSRGSRRSRARLGWDPAHLSRARRAQARPARQQGGVPRPRYQRTQDWCPQFVVDDAHRSVSLLVLARPFRVRKTTLRPRDPLAAIFVRIRLLVATRGCHATLVTRRRGDEVSEHHHRDQDGRNKRAEGRIGRRPTFISAHRPGRSLVSRQREVLSKGSPTT